MTQRLHLSGLDIDKSLAELVAIDIAPGTGVEPNEFWEGLASALKVLVPRNQALLQRREDLQRQIDDYYHQRRVNGEGVDEHESLHAFLKEIGYIVPAEHVKITVSEVDPEIAMVAGPQLVVPVMNPRYAINAANARWGSLYDALYGSDVIDSADGCEPRTEYNQLRGQKVVAYVAEKLDEILPLVSGQHHQVTAYQLKSSEDGSLSLAIKLNNGKTTMLQDDDAFVGHHEGRVLLFQHHGLHLELHIDPQSPVGRDHPAGLKDVVLESAITTIQDCEDSVAAVDAQEKVHVYRNWLGLMQGQLSESFEKNGRIVDRRLAPNRYYLDRQGQTLQLPGRSLMLVRNVGLLMTTDAVLFQGNPIPEGILDAFMTSFAAMHDIKNNSCFKNSRTNSMYIVKPKLHGPDEVQFTVDLFALVEQTLQLPENTIKIGIMDEERRTTLNLGTCIARAASRVIFINTGFLDRTGDEIHTCMEAGPVVEKTEMKSQSWINAYERWNVDIGLMSGFRGKAQIGKGMWPKPDVMKDMVATKQAHPAAGANCAWVPSPTAAVLHALHYHQVNVAQVQQDLEHRTPQTIDELLMIPLMQTTPDPEKIQFELQNNAQGILGYVVRWIQQGIGCSKVPDIHDIGLMEDRATLRISSQHMANWLFHGLVSEEEVLAVMRKMAVVVDHQNAEDPNYQTMAPDFQTSIAFQAACDLVLKGRSQPSGYTEPLLHHYRLAYKKWML